MKKIFFFILAIVILVLFPFHFLKEKKEDRVCYKDQCIEVEVALKDKERMLGLMFRSSLDENKGMLFVFPEPKRYAFWMKNTLIPLDMIWLSPSRQVVDIKENVPPCKADPCPTYGPEGDASFVLEVNTGKAKRMGLYRGAEFEFYLESFLAR